MAISLKRVKIEEQLLWGAYRNSPTPFRMVPFPTPTAYPSPRLGVRTPHPELRSILSQERARPQTSNLAGTFRVHPNKSPLKFSRKGKVGVSRSCPILEGYPLLSQSRVMRRTSSFVRRFIGPIRTDIKDLKNSSRGRRQGIPKVFSASLGHFCDSTAFLLCNPLDFSCGIMTALF